MSAVVTTIARTAISHHFFVIWPESVASDITTSADAEVLVVRAPSVANDKFAVTG
jgi:hypothetical protein